MSTKQVSDHDQERISRWEKISQTIDELQRLQAATFEAQQRLIDLRAVDVDADNLEDGYFLWRYLPHLRGYLSGVEPGQALSSENPCVRLAALWGTKIQSVLPECVSLSGSTAFRNPRDNRLRFCISGEVCLDEFGKVSVEALLGIDHASETKQNTPNP